LGLAQTEKKKGSAGKMNKILLLTLLLLSLVSCSSETDAVTERNGLSIVSQMSVQELKSLQTSDESFYLFDVREEWEREIAQIADSRILNEKTVKFIGDLERDSLMVFQCRTGSRSQSAAEYFQKQGFTRVFNLAGGIDAWSIEIDPEIVRYSKKDKNSAVK
jgi:rhodanese-related sulfurtransferase